VSPPANLFLDSFQIMCWSCWEHFKIIVGELFQIFGLHSRILLEILLAHLGFVLGCFGEQLGNAFGTCLANVGHMLATFQDHFRDTLGPLWDDF
jgi:hypothetical protein